MPQRRPGTCLPSMPKSSQPGAEISLNRTAVQLRSITPQCPRVHSRPSSPSYSYSVQRYSYSKRIKPTDADHRITGAKRNVPPRRENESVLRIRDVSHCTQDSETARGVQYGLVCDAIISGRLWASTSTAALSTSTESRGSRQGGMRSDFPGVGRTVWKVAGGSARGNGATARVQRRAAAKRPRSLGNPLDSVEGHFRTRPPARAGQEPSLEWCQLRIVPVAE